MPSEFHDNAPLVWPAEWINPSPIQRASIGLPLIGLDSRIFRSFARKLATRDGSILKAWQNDPVLTQIRDNIAACLARMRGWPNTLFHPDDPCAILFWTPQSDLEIPETILMLAKRFNVSPNVFDRLDQISFGQLVERIRTEMTE